MALEIRSEVAGTVFQVEVSAGARVAAGDTLLILESMKMEIPVDAPRDGIVAKVTVAEKEVVKEGQVLLVLE